MLCAVQCSSAVRCILQRCGVLTLCVFKYQSEEILDYVPAPLKKEGPTRTWKYQQAQQAQEVAAQEAASTQSKSQQILQKDEQLAALQKELLEKPRDQRKEIRSQIESVERELSGMLGSKSLIGAAVGAVVQDETPAAASCTSPDMAPIRGGGKTEAEKAADKQKRERESIRSTERLLVKW